MTSLSPTITITASFLALCLSACGSGEEGVDAESDVIGAEPREDGSGARADDAAGGRSDFGERPNFVAPEGWEEREPSNQMRLIEYQVGDDGDLLVIVSEWLGGIGGVDPNVVRWANEVGVAKPVNELDESQRWEAQYGDYSATVVHLTGSGGTEHGVGSEGAEAEDDAKAVLAAYIELPGYSSVWTIKLSGTPEEVAGQKENFEAFLEKL